jgi:hypothetical protein
MEPKSVWGGPEGETLFNRQFARVRRNELPSLFIQVEDLHDHRLLALVTALIVENRIEVLLEGLCPRFNRLTEIQTFGFSLKIRMLEALSLIPRSITDACHLIREIRNEFAHNLEITCFADMPPKTMRKMATLLKRVKSDWGKSELTNDTLSKNFRQISFLAIVGVDGYRDNTDRLRIKISKPEFIEELRKEAKEEICRNFEESKKRGPKFVTPSGKKWSVHYDSFSETVDEPPQGIPVVSEHDYSEALRAWRQVVKQDGFKSVKAKKK